MLAKSWFRANMTPQQVFPDISLFGNPAWNIMLDLYIAWHGHASISVTSACVASGGSPSTAIRYINILIDAGVMIKVPDPVDGRRSNLQLTDKGIDGVEQAIDRSSEPDRKAGLGEVTFA